MYQKLIPASLVSILAGLSLVLSLISRLWQSYCIYTAKSTGNLSAITMLMLFFGSIARIFTSIQETGDPTLIWTYILNTLANSLLIFQLGYYWSAPAPISEETKKSSINISFFFCCVYREKKNKILKFFVLFYCR